ncbi:DUF3575 domain-containing protein [Bacteroides helcogenes]|uniref:DUF3575 domain-containing protein n=1 Tax=Bacteroides helcogenes (strain ATCC 35417 / DSM 20613 / JCM 6297 / CCUG 15421 / P 36-108) TaxID=693979 RepID=E6SNF1_BACT6|nr:DUF3575 domain-containing protein [Bacteroides helcogenes]ADV42744.1 hypothetical protein Bache_0721 [Bacteroides helcogenes P 36-108]MDY5239575.1 DUF3575 domain-containing protein [Bacteroides helcogenes]
MTKRKVKEAGLLICLLLIAMGTKAQDVSIKTNLIYDFGTLTPDLGIEVGLAKKWSFDGLVAYAPFSYDGNKTKKHLLIQPGVRYWLCTRGSGSFFGLHGHWGAFNEGGYKLPFGLFSSIQDNRYEGKLWGGGISYGYQYPLSRHWALEGEIGAGFNHAWYDIYQCPTCGDKIGEGKKNFFSPTKAVVNIIYQF